MLFVSLLTAIICCVVPFGERASPVLVLLDTVKHRLNKYLTRGDKKELYQILDKEVEDVISIGLLIGGAFGVLGFLITVLPLGGYAIVVGVAFFISGLFLTEIVLSNEYRRWQDKLLEGIPTLINFMPSFLEVGTITPREAINLTIPFLSNPLRAEMMSVVNKIARTGKIHEPMDALANRAKHPVIDAICFRISAAWDTRVTPDIFIDLNDEIENMNQMAAARTTAAKSGLLALLCVLGLLGALLVYGYPALMFLLVKIGGAFV